MSTATASVQPLTGPDLHLVPLLRKARRAAIQSPRLSVVIVNYHQWDDTARLVRQLRRNRSMRDGTSEVVIVDNHSPASRISTALRRCPGVSLRRWGSNRGFARAVNEGCRLSRGDWFLLLNPDVSVPDGFLDRVLAQAQELLKLDPRMGILGFQLRHGDGSLQGSSGPFPTLTGTLLRLLLPRSRRKYDVLPARERSRVSWVTGCCLLVRRDCLGELDGFDEDYFLYYEDVDLCLRAQARGWSVWFEPALHVVHHHPLHCRRVEAPLRVSTRHALLSYAAKHWPRWQIKVLAGIVRGEAWTAVVWPGGKVMASRPTISPIWVQSPSTLRGSRLDPPAAGSRHWSGERSKPVSVELSIVIPSSTRADLLAACLASVVRHAPGGTEILVVDDGSPGEAVQRTAERFVGVRTISMTARHGFCAAANAGIRQSHGRVVELLNDDTEVTAGWAELALAHFSNAEIAAVAPLVLHWPAGDRIDSAGDSYHLAGFASKRGQGQTVERAPSGARWVFGASGSSAFYRREAVLRVGAFPDHFSAYFEDVDLAFRLNRAGYRAIFEPASRILHHVSASYGAPRRSLLEQQSCNEERVYWRNLPTTSLPVSLPLHALALAAKAYLRWREGSLAPFVRAAHACVQGMARARTPSRQPATPWAGVALAKLGDGVAAVER